MPNTLTRVADWLGGGVQDLQIVIPLADRLNLQRLRWSALLIAAIASIQCGAALFSASPVLDIFRSLSWLWVHALVGCVMSGIALLAWATPRGESSAYHWLVFSGLLVTLLYCAAWAAAGERPSAGGSVWPLLLGCVAAGAMFVLRPRVALLLFITVAVTHGWVLSVWHGEPAPRGLAWFAGVASAMLGLMLSLATWRTFAAMTLLQRGLDAASEALAAKHKEVEFLARHDHLTGLNNRREFAQLADMELARAARYHTPTCVLIADIDHFRQVNARYGEAAGDKVLRQVAEALQKGVRTTDIVARLGGEEFIILLPQTDLDAAQGLAEKLRRGVALTTTMDGQRPISVTVSIGLSATAPGGLDNLYGAADQALSEAKRLGRNRVHVG